MDDAERKAFVNAVLPTVGRDKAEKFVKEYHSEKGIDAKSRDDDYTFLYDAIHIWEEARDHFFRPVKHKRKD